MLPKHTLLVAIQPLLAVTSLAAPVEVPAALAPRQTACPVATRWQSYWYTTIWLSTTTMTNGWSSLGSVTSTKTESETRTINKVETVYSPSVTTLPTITITPVVATVASPVIWFTTTETVTSPGYAPPSLCQVTTVTSSIPSTTSVTVTRPLLYGGISPLSHTCRGLGD
ncbi:hypothetical protein C8A05DRAFT_11557 [Staphylotrichum tortipilum]|uniref:Uncharacterized protein n=1 Tax=Staphylotrichum tortipilum TaxID=2831512 RepID=A0AAN6MTA8_9PEZI|nr:hypothetical protein C8A05DRAFT_11557 [Staphylotrichum longicolle]